MTKNRRNYYRILQTQPDASVEVIKNNFRTLLQKLKLHPDLGGDNWNASLINLAYNTLRNPVKRAAYDQELLRYQKISTLSQGHLSCTPIASTNRNNITQKNNNINKRNYYRLLHIQPDSPAAIIEASYNALIKKPNMPKELLKEAYLVLMNRERRAYYDRLITNFHHSDVISPQSHQGTIKSGIKIMPGNQGLTPHILGQNSRKHDSKLAHTQLVKITVGINQFINRLSNSIVYFTKRPTRTAHVHLVYNCVTNAKAHCTHLRKH